MDGMLSQDEINSLLNGMGTDGGGADADAGSAEGGAAEDAASSNGVDESLLTEEEKDALGEVANISMGSSATTLFSLVNQKVNITTPRVSLQTWNTLASGFERPCVFVQIQYKVGLDGTDIMVLKESDVKVITDLMMGGDGTNTEGELGELHLSAISEAMNQMMGAAATSLSTMLGKMVDISPPEASLIDLTDFGDPADIADFLTGTFAVVTFSMQIGENLVDSTIMQLYPIDFAKELQTLFVTPEASEDQSQPPEMPEAAPAAAAAPPPAAAAPPPMMDAAAQMGAPQPMPQMGYAPPPGYGMPMGYGMPNVNVQPASFQNFSTDINPMQPQENINLIKDVPLEVTVELGRTHKTINEILDFSPGTIIELEKIAGEPIDVLVNGKHVAKGEVVVIEESFGVRVTEIIK
ncbi:MAG: flagellar motor switch phosphatase FliY [Lachnospiraceae bacterium]|nr:flagellar motor switch phosphatase FliY [Lachnospiraceae bacterium]